MAKSTVKIVNPNGKVEFEKEDFIHPDHWNKSAVDIFAHNYTIKNETSVNETLDRILSPFEKADKKTIKQAIIDQKVCFNSPVMFNFGTSTKPVGSACFITGIEDSMESIAEMNRQSMIIFKYGAGLGCNFSPLRGSCETLSGSDSIASGPISFMRIFDCIGGVVKSGGRQRRAAENVTLNINHPDIVQFIDCKLQEEKKAHVLADAGYGYGITSESYSTVAFQNMNINVALFDDFMTAVENDEEYELTARTTGKVTRKIRARELLMQIASAAYECGDPGVQFLDTVNRDNPFRDLGKGYTINASNPCSEFFFIDNSACNLASINLNKFYDGEHFDFEGVGALARTIIRAMDEIIDISAYPTTDITINSKYFRPLGLGYTGLGSVLMRMCLPYGSKDALEFVETITKTMSKAAWKASAELYDEIGSPMSETEQNGLCRYVLNKYGIIAVGFRNSQTTLLAPTGTISWVMGSGDSTGIEPVVAIKAQKTTVIGNVMEIQSSAASEALTKLNCSFADLNSEQRKIFATSIGENMVSIDAHLATMAAAQKWIDGAISKTINLPKNITKEEIYDLYVEAWKNGIKAVAVYRSGSKMSEPLSIEKKTKFVRMPNTRKSITHHFEIMGQDGYITLGMYKDGRIGEVFVNMSKVGSTVQGLINSWSVAVSKALQHGVPIEDFVRKFKGMSFDPSGITTDADIPMCTSIVDYVMRFIELLDKDIEIKENVEPCSQAIDDIQTCPNCGNIMFRVGKCHQCQICGISGGCS